MSANEKGARQPNPGDLVKALELVGPNKTEVYSTGILLDLEAFDSEPTWFTQAQHKYLVATILEHSGNTRKFICDPQQTEWLGAVWLIKAHENDDE